MTAPLACAAGVTWTRTTANAPWAGRYGHATVIDSRGTIYVLGGTDSSGTLLSDVWRSTDGGETAHSTAHQWCSYYGAVIVWKGYW